MDGMYSPISDPPAVTGERTYSVADPPSATVSPSHSEQKSTTPSPGNQRRVVTDVDQTTGRVVGVFIDKKTGEVVDQIPSEAMLRLLAKTRAMLGSLFDEKV